MQPRKPDVFTIWSFTRKVGQSLICRIRLVYSSCLISCDFATLVPRKMKIWPFSCTSSPCLASRVTCIRFLCSYPLPLLEQCWPRGTLFPEVLASFSRHLDFSFAENLNCSPAIRLHSPAWEWTLTPLICFSWLSTQVSGPVHLSNLNINGALSTGEALNGLFTESMTELMGHVISGCSSQHPAQLLTEDLIDTLIFLQEVRNVLSLSPIHSPQIY